MKLYMKGIIFVIIFLDLSKTSDSVIAGQVNNGIPSFTLPPPPSVPSYKAANTTYDDGGLGPFFDFARSFINSVFPGGFPKQFVQDVSDGKVKLDSSLLTKIKDLFLNFFITVGIGVVFIIVFPIVGCCFCCCRVVCGCCCDRPQTEDKKSSCKKKVYGTILFILTTFTLVGNVCVFVSNERMTVALDELADSVNNNMDDITTFLDTTIKQVEQIRNNFKATSDVINQELDGTKISETLSKRAVAILTNGSVNQLQRDMDKSKETVKNLQKDFNDLVTGMSSLQSKIKSMCGSCNPPGLQNVPSLPTIPPTNPMTKIIPDLKSKIDSILGGNIKGQINLAKDQINGLNTKIDSVVNGMKDAVHNAQGFDIDSTKNTINDAIGSLKPYDKYRWYGGIGLASVILLVVSLQYFGLVFGIFGSCSTYSDPRDKGCLSNSGGRMLIASVAFIFIFSSLLMLLTTVLFVPGSLLERFVCQPLSDPEMTTLDDIMQKFINLKDIMKYRTDVTMSDVLSSCRDKKSAYTAFRLEQSDLLPMKISDLTKKIEDAKQEMNLEDKLKSLTSASGGLAALTLPSADIKAIGTQFNNIDLTSAENSITQARSSLQSLKSMIQSLPGMQQTMGQELKDIELKINRLQGNISDLKKLILQVNNVVTNIDQGLQKAVGVLRTSGMKDITEGFVQRIFDIVDIFVNNTETSVYTDLGSCEPLWNLYHSFIVVSVCSYTIDSLNGIWFSIGWCILFFIPSIIFSVKFSNLVRDVDDLDENENRSSNFELKRSNKVGHTDKVV